MNEWRKGLWWNIDLWIVIVGKGRTRGKANTLSTILLRHEHVVYNVSLNCIPKNPASFFVPPS